MDNISTIVLGASCGALCIAGSYFILNMGTTSRKLATKEMPLKEENDDELFPAGRMYVYFGSQTGTAEGFARIIEKEGISRGFNAKKVDLEDFDPSQLAECRLAVFLMATYGEGEHTDNSTSFNNWMKNESMEERGSFLKDISFTVFGLGNRQYEHFNQMGKRTNEALHNYGGKRVFTYGEGDDDGSLEDDFEKWKSSMWIDLVKKFHPNASAAADNSDEEIAVQLTYKLIPSNSSATSTVKVHSNKPFFQSKVAKVTSNRELRVGSTHDNNVGSTRCIEISLEGTGLSYNTADNLAVLPENNPVNVTALCNLLGYSSNQLYSIEHTQTSKDVKDDFPSPFTSRDVLTKFLDLEGLPRASTLEQFIPYLQDEKQKEWLRKLVSKDHRSEFKVKVESEGKTTFELLLNELSSIKIPLVDLMHIVPHMQPRYYTISSSSSLYPTSVHITVAVTESVYASGKKSKGLCSGYLQGLCPNQSTCRVFVRPSTFHLPKQLSTPIIMIGPGTGIAPMRALLQERKFLGASSNGSNNKSGKNTLYFGCKNRDVDYLYRNEIEEYHENNTVSSLHLAFSREQTHKVYVQQLIKSDENGKNLVQDLENDGHVYVCGGTSMGADVMDAVIDVISIHKAISKNSATEYVKILQQKGRYVQELWSSG